MCIDQGKKKQHICLCSLSKGIIYFGAMSGNTRIKVFKGYILTFKSFKQILRLKLYLFETSYVLIYSFTVADQKHKLNFDNKVTPNVFIAFETVFYVYNSSTFPSCQ